MRRATSARQKTARCVMLIEYETRIELPQSTPMNGRSILIGKYKNIEEAVSAAKQTHRESAYVIEVQYTSDENYKRGFSLQTFMRWNKYIQGAEAALAEKDGKHEH